MRRSPGKLNALKCMPLEYVLTAGFAYVQFEESMFSERHIHHKGGRRQKLSYNPIKYLKKRFATVMTYIEMVQ